MRLATLFAFSAAAVSALTSGGKEATKRLHVIRVSFTANTLANIASFLPDHAHDFPFTKRVGPEKGKEKFVTTPVEWLAADGTKIASMVWDGTLGDTTKSNTMHHEPPVGMPVLFAAMGVTLPGA